MSGSKEKIWTEMRIRAEGCELYFDKEASHTTRHTAVASCRNAGLAQKLADRWNESLKKEEN